MDRNPFLEFASPGHFYSPLPDMDFVERHKAMLFDRQRADVPGIDLRVEGQLALLNEFAGYYRDMPFTEQPAAGLRYYFENPYYSYGDAIVLYSMLRHRRPKRIVEVGSGFSSAVMLDTMDRFCAGQTTMTFIEPYPERLLSLLSDDDVRRHEIIRDIVQHVSVSQFTTLQSGDMLFIDSSHVAKVGSDVVYLVTEVLPQLQAGVVVHFHDVFWPFEYPEDWIRAGRAWNESYFLRAFLEFNSGFMVLFFNSYMANRHAEAAARCLPLFMKNPGGGLWVVRTGNPQDR